MAEAIRSSSIVFTLVLLSHWIACLFWLVTNAENLIGNVDPTVGACM